MKNRYTNCIYLFLVSLLFSACGSEKYYVPTDKDVDEVKWIEEKISEESGIKEEQEELGRRLITSDPGHREGYGRNRAYVYIFECGDVNKQENIIAVIRDLHSRNELYSRAIVMKFYDIQYKGLYPPPEEVREIVIKP